MEFSTLTYVMQLIADDR